MATERLILLTLLHQGGAIMWPLFGLMIATLVIGIERFCTYSYLYYKKQICTKDNLERPLALLDFIAMLAPVLGFLGTVTGMISAFKSVSEATSVQLQVVASGLYEALFTTAFGLIISIVATVFSFILDLAMDYLCAENNTH